MGGGTDRIICVYSDNLITTKNSTNTSTSTSNSTSTSTCTSTFFIFNMKTLGILREFAQSHNAPIGFFMSVYLSVRTHVSARLTLDGFPQNLILGTLRKPVQNRRIFVKIGQKYRTHNTKTAVCCSVAGHIHSP